MSLRNKHVRLAVIPNIHMDMRSPRMIHRYKRWRECLKVRS